MTTAILPANNGAVEQGAILLAVLASSRDHKAHAVAIHDGFMSKFVYFCCGLLLSHTGQKQDMQNHPVVDALHQIHEKARMVLPNWIQISKYKCTTKQKGAVGLENVEQGTILLAVLASSDDHKARAVAIHEVSSMMQTRLLPSI